MRGVSRTLACGLLIALALGLAGCGRKGPLDMPPGDTLAPQANSNLTQPAFGSSALMPGSSQQPPSGQAPNAYDAHGNPIYQPPPKNKSFILDPVLQ